MQSERSERRKPPIISRGCLVRGSLNELIAIHTAIIRRLPMIARAAREQELLVFEALLGE